MENMNTIASTWPLTHATFCFYLFQLTRPFSALEVIQIENAYSWEQREPVCIDAAFFLLEFNSLAQAQLAPSTSIRS